MPGEYTVTLTVDGKSYKQTVTVKNDPRSPANAGNVRTQVECQVKLYNGVKEAWAANHAVAAMRAAITEATRGSKSADVTKAAAAIDAKLVTIGGAAGGRGRGGGGGGFRGGAPAGPPSFSSVNGMLVRELGTMDPGDMAPNEPQMKACKAACDALDTVAKAWKTFNTKDLVEFNALLVKNSLKPVAPAGEFGMKMR